MSWPWSAVPGAAGRQVGQAQQGGEDEERRQADRLQASEADACVEAAGRDPGRRRPPGRRSTPAPSGSWTLPRSSNAAGGSGASGSPATRARARARLIAS